MLHGTPRLYITRFSQQPVVAVNETFYYREKLESKLLKIIVVFSKRKSIIIFS